MNFTRIFCAAAAAMMTGFCCESFAQRYSPTETWPYLNEEFASGVVRSFDGAVQRSSDLNIEIAGGTLHYIDNGVIMKAEMGNVARAVIGPTSYVNIAGRMHRVLAESEYGSVVEDTEVDFDNLRKADIGYGISSSTASVMNTSLISLGLDAESGYSIINNDLAHVRENRNSGNAVPVKTRKYIFVDGVRIAATKRAVTASGKVDKKAFGAFVKENRIKWDSAESLLKVLEFIAKSQK